MVNAATFDGSWPGIARESCFFTIITVISFLLTPPSQSDRSGKENSTAMAVTLHPRNPQLLSRAVWLHRKRSGLSRVMLAELAGVGKTTIFDIEHGKTSVGLETLLKVLDVLNMQLLLDGPMIAQLEENDAQS